MIATPRGTHESEQSIDERSFFISCWSRNANDHEREGARTSGVTD
jgi:hypothetical protein